MWLQHSQRLIAINPLYVFKTACQNYLDTVTDSTSSRPATDALIAELEKTNVLTVISVIDNLLKGAAGQAVQNLNLMQGWDETEGLLMTPSYL